MRFLPWLLFLWMVEGIFWRGPSATPVIKYTPDSLGPIVPTSTPVAYHDLLKRATSSSSIHTWGSDICGWEYGEYSSEFSCRSSSSTCLWNSRLSIVGCGNAAVQPFVTACVNFNSTSCDAACSANPAILKCDSFFDICYNVQFPNSYYSPACGYSTSTVMSIALTYGGVPTPLYLPRYLGADGTVTVETQYPDGYTSSPTSSPSSETSPPSSPPKETNIGPIVGGVLGGVALLAAVGIGVFIFMRRRRRAVAVQQYQAVDKPDLPPGGRVELSGMPKPVVEIGETRKPKNAYELG